MGAFFRVLGLLARGPACRRGRGVVLARGRALVARGPSSWWRCQVARPALARWRRRFHPGFFLFYFYFHPGFLCLDFLAGFFASAFASFASVFASALASFASVSLLPLESLIMLLCGFLFCLPAKKLIFHFLRFCLIAYTDSLYV